MKHIVVIAVAVISFSLAFPLTKSSAQQSSSTQPLTPNVELKEPPIKPVTTTEVAITPTPAPPPKPIIKTPPVYTPTAPVPPPIYTSNSHTDLMARAGITSSDFAAVEYIVSRESGWNPNATEPTSGAHGLPQALPYGKTGCGWVDSVCQLRWADKYAKERFGGWWAAQGYWAAHKNW